MVVVQKWQFFQIFFQEIKSRTMCFTKFQNEKTPLQTMKKRTLKSRKINIFPKELTHGFGPEMAIFQVLFFRQYRTGKCLLRYSTKKQTPCQAIKTTSSKSPRIDIFPKGLTHCFGPKMAIFPTFFLGDRGHENVFYEFVERKNAFLGYKNKKFKKSEN